MISVSKSCNLRRKGRALRRAYMVMGELITSEECASASFTRGAVTK